MDAKQHYVSNELTHFVGRDMRKGKMDNGQLLNAQYEVLLRVIREKCISYDPHKPSQIPSGMKYAPNGGRRINLRSTSNNEMIVPFMVCFCDIPIEDLRIHINKFSPLGLSFKKSFLIERGANPVLYVEINSAITYTSGLMEEKNRSTKNSIRSKYFREMVNCYAKYCSSYLECVRTSDPSKINKRSQQCIDIGEFMLDLLGYIKFFDANKPDDDKENFYMEREWRSPYNIHFELNDICRIILPSSYEKRFQDDVPECAGKIYPYIIE